MAVILTVNPGSSSIKLGIIDAERDYLVTRYQETRGIIESPQTLLKDFLRRAAIGNASPIVAHRVVHGGPHLTSTQLIDKEVESKIRNAGIFAPLHNSQTLEWIKACKRAFGQQVKQVAVMDTSFFADLPKRASTYALPQDITRKYSIRRLGFHGIAHRSMWRQFCFKRPDLVHGGKIITFHLGAGASVAAIKGGKPIDTSMGFTPLEGLVMATRCGDVDPGVLLYLMKLGLSPEELDKLLFHESGLLGLCGISSDFAKLTLSNDENAQLALDVYAYRARKYLGAYLAVLEGTDGIIFSGGVGEHASAIRQKIVGSFSWCGIRIDEEKNKRVVGRLGKINSNTSKVDIWVLAADEAFELALEAKDLQWT